MTLHEGAPKLLDDEGGNRSSPKHLSNGGSSNNAFSEQQRTPLVSHVPPPKLDIGEQQRQVAETPDSGMITQEEEVLVTSARKPLNFLASMATKGGNDMEDDSLLHNNDDDDDDGGSSLSSTLSSDDEEEEDEDDDAVEEMEEETLMEKAARNRQRNELFLQRLNEEYKGKVPEMRRKRKAGNFDSNDNAIDEEVAAPKGILQRDRLLWCKQDLTETSSCRSLPDRIQQLQERYPARQTQIRRLASVLLATVAQTRPSNTPNDVDATTAATMVHVPAPLLLVGPRGTGKTSIVCDVLQSIQKHQNQAPQSTTAAAPLGIGYAYINCATLDPYSIDRLVTSAYNQLRPEEYVRFKTQRRKQLRMRKRKRKAQQQLVSPNSDGRMNGTVNGKRMEEKQEGNAKESSDTTTMDRRQGVSKSDVSKRKDLPDSESDRRVQPRRTAKAPTQTVVHATKTVTTSSSQATSGDSVEIAHSAVVAFGRSLNPFYGPGANRCAFLVIDNGERLLTLSSGKKQPNKGHTNFLAELLLLPKVMRLNLTVIVLTRYSSIAATRLNNIASATKSLSTIASGLRPIMIQFPAYRGNQVFKQILKTDFVHQEIVGTVNATKQKRIPFQDKVIDSFHTALIQFLAESTRDINDYIRLGRSYWPVYIEPISHCKIQKTMDTIQAKKKTSGACRPTDEDVLSYLGQRLLRLISALPRGIVGTTVDSPMVLSSTSNNNSLAQKNTPRHNTNNNVSLPYLQSCLLLAAFICQRNRPEQDKLFFSTRSNGRRKANSKNRDPESSEAYASTAGDVLQLQTLRPRPFQLERVFTVFVSLVKLNPTKQEDPEMFSSLGSTRLHNDISQLIDLGYLHRIGYEGGVKGEQINLNNAKLWCSLTTEEAFDIAKEVHIPLQHFILKA